MQGSPPPSASGCPAQHTLGMPLWVKTHSTQLGGFEARQVFLHFLSAAGQARRHVCSGALAAVLLLGSLYNKSYFN